MPDELARLRAHAGKQRGGLAQTLELALVERVVAAPPRRPGGSSRGQARSRLPGPRPRALPRPSERPSRHMPVSTWRAAGRRRPRRRAWATHRTTSCSWLRTGRRSCRGAGLLPAGAETVQDEDAAVGDGRAQRQPLGQAGHEEAAAAGAGKCRGNRHRTQAVGVGLDHGRHLARCLPAGRGGDSW